MTEENKSIQNTQYYPTINPGYKMSVGANGQGTVFDTNGNIFHFTSPNDNYQKLLQDANYQGNVELTADNRTMIAAGKDLLSTPFFKLDKLGSLNYETSDEELSNNDFINPPPPNDPEVTYEKKGDTWEFKFLEQNRGISGFNLTNQSATGQDAIHQLSNVAANIVGQDLKQLYSNGKYYKVDMNNIKMEYGKDTNNKTYYYITIPLISVKDDKSAYINFEHKGSWTTIGRATYVARLNALTNIYGSTPFDDSISGGGKLDTWNFPKTNVNPSDPKNKGWGYFNTIKQNFPTYEYVEVSTGTDNNIYEIWFQWFDPSTVGKLPPQSSTQSSPPSDDEFSNEYAQIFETLPFDETQDPPVRELIGKAGDDLDIEFTEEDVKELDFALATVYENQTITNGGEYKTVSDAVNASISGTPDGQLFEKYMLNYVFPNEGTGGKAEAGDKGGLTSHGLTIGSWKVSAPKVFPGRFKGTAEELASLATAPDGKDVVLAVAKAAYFDVTNKGADNTVPDIFKILALQDKWGGQNLDPTGNRKDKGNPQWTNAKKRFDYCKGDVVAGFAVMWGWIRSCGSISNPQFNLSGMPSPRWGMGWTKRVGVAWFSKDPATGKVLPAPLPYKVLVKGKFPKESVYAFYLNECKGVDFCNGRTADIYNLFGSSTFKGKSWSDLNTLTDYTTGKITYSNTNGVSITWDGRNACVNCT